MGEWVLLSQTTFDNCPIPYKEADNPDNKGKVYRLEHIIYNDPSSRLMFVLGKGRK